MATITYNSTIGVITQDNAVVTARNPLPLGINVDTTGAKCFVTISTYDLTNSAVIDTIASGLQMLQLTDNDFVCDIAPIIEGELVETPINGGNYELTVFQVVVQAQIGSNVYSKTFLIYPINETRQFGENPEICDITDANLNDYLTPSMEYWASVGRAVTIYRYVVLVVNGRSHLWMYAVNNTWNTTGDKTFSHGNNHTVHVEDVCDDDIILTFLDHRGMFRQTNIGRYYEERIAQGDSIATLNPYVNIYSGYSDTKDVSVDGERTIVATKSNVGRNEMEIIKDIITSPCVYLSKGTSADKIRVRVNVTDNTVFSTRKPFANVGLEITMPKYYTI